MGEAKRRKAVLGDDYGKDPYIWPWLPVTKSQADRFMKLTTRISWFGIGALVVIWLTVRFIGPSFGWWTIQ